MGEVETIEGEEEDEELNALLAMASGTEDPEDDDDGPELTDHEPARPPLAQPIPTLATDVKNVRALEALFDQFASTAHSMLSNASEDRNQLDEAIGILGNKIRTNDRVPGAVIEQWVNAMRAKADLNVSTTKLLDSIAKL
ncbi:MAG: hypothetical protein ACXADH_15770, partial [Candidatus Kariarchaeaceae archaeon]